MWPVFKIIIPRVKRPLEATWSSGLSEHVYHAVPSPLHETGRHSRVSNGQREEARGQDVQKCFRVQSSQLPLKRASKCCCYCPFEGRLCKGLCWSLNQSVSCVPGSSSSVLDEEVFIFYDCLQEMNLSSQTGASLYQETQGRWIASPSFSKEREAQKRVAKDPKRSGSLPAPTSTEERTLFQPHLPIPIHGLRAD